jgi:hypothetical protein
MWCVLFGHSFIFVTANKMMGKWWSRLWECSNCESCFRTFLHETSQPDKEVVKSIEEARSLK